MDLRPGSRWRSAVCDTEVVVVRPPTVTVDAELKCGGSPMVPYGEPRTAAGAAVDQVGSGSQAGKRYVDSSTGIELLCTKGGAGALAIGDRPIETKDSKKLPASD